MVTLMRTAMRIACGTQYTDRQTNKQTDQQLTHPSDKWSPSVTHTRVQDLADVVGKRGRFASRSQIAAAKAKVSAANPPRQIASKP